MAYRPDGLFKIWVGATVDAAAMHCILQQLFGVYIFELLAQLAQNEGAIVREMETEEAEDRVVGYVAVQLLVTGRFTPV